jgi:hypothetical protein
MRTPVIIALGLAALVASPAHAGCAAVTDPAGDVQVAPGAAVPDGHVDLRTVTFNPTAAGLVVRFTDTRLDNARKGMWHLTFTSRGTQVYVDAGMGAWTNIGDGFGFGGFRAGVVGRTEHGVRGAVDYATSTITVTVPYRAFGKAVRRGAALTNLAVTVQESFVHENLPPVPREDVLLTDTASAERLVLARC